MDSSYEDDGWHHNLSLTDKNNEKKTGPKSKISPNMFTRHRLMDRDGKDSPEFNSVIRAGRISSSIL